ncbi:MAG: hypothetical protein RBG13Loki_4120 [Promethearchaeota archaeon CR_4]|nr:MAG: hypothetical protein RBG13Loki_4120 [Candidatus Lokiarchaeota archaeon CR_4]
MDMEEKPTTKSPLTYKKIILCGPPGAGKTTVKQIFFEKANPLRLLNTTLEPTKGFETSIYHQLKNEIAVFDLGGQENKRWFDSDQEIFLGTDFILYICPVVIPINEIASFLFTLSHIIRDQCPDARLLFLYHKRDLITIRELNKRIRTLRQFLNQNTPEILGRITIYLTSIGELYFFTTYRIFEEILRMIISRENFYLKSETLQQVELSLRVLLEFLPEVKYHIDMLISRYHIAPSEALLALGKLKEMNFVKYHYIPDGKILESFQLTQQAKFYVAGIKRNLIYPNKFTEDLRSCQNIFTLFSQLKKNI